MSFTTYATAVAGSVLTAAFWNVQVRDNGTEIRQGGISIASQGPGEFLYAANVSQFGRMSTLDPYHTLRGGGPSAVQNIGLQTKWFPASQFTPNWAYGPSGSLQNFTSAQNCGIRGLPFAPNATQAASMTWVMPKAWDGGNFTAQIYWTAQDGSGGGVSWYLNVNKAYGAGEDLTNITGNGSAGLPDNAQGAHVLCITNPYAAGMATPGYRRLNRILVWRNSDGANTYPGTAIFLGLLLTYNNLSVCDN